VTRYKVTRLQGDKVQGNVTGLDEKLSDELTSLHVNTKAHFGSVLETVFLYLGVNIPYYRY